MMTCSRRLSARSVGQSLSFFFFLSATAALLAAADPPEIHAESAILFDANTGEVLYRKNDTMQTPVASTQKLLTSLLVAKAGNLEKEIVIEKADTEMEPTKLYIKPGDSYNREELLTALLVKSANDAAHALGRDNAGSVELFADRMNVEARRLGARNSNFVNPNGLPDDQQFSTARDMAYIARAAYRNPVLREIMALEKYTFTHDSGKRSTLTNTNRVLRTYSFCNGMKTGYTNASGHCLIASGSYGGREMIAVVLRSDRAHVWDDATALLSFGLGIDPENFRSES